MKLVLFVMQGLGVGPTFHCLIAEQHRGQWQRSLVAMLHEFGQIKNSLQMQMRQRGIFSKRLFFQNSLGFSLKNFLEPAMSCHLPVLIYLCGERQGKRPKVYAKEKGSKNFFTFHFIEQMCQIHTVSIDVQVKKFIDVLHMSIKGIKGIKGIHTIHT